MEADLYAALKNSNLFILSEDYYFDDNNKKDLLCISCAFWTPGDSVTKIIIKGSSQGNGNGEKVQDRSQVATCFECIF